MQGLQSADTILPPAAFNTVCGSQLTRIRHKRTSPELDTRREETAGVADSVLKDSARTIDAPSVRFFRWAGSDADRIEQR